MQKGKQNDSIQNEEYEIIENLLKAADRLRVDTSVKENRKRNREEQWLHDYRRARKLHQELCTKMNQEYNAAYEHYDEQLKLNFCRSGVQDVCLDFHDSMHLQFFFDMLIYKYFDTECLCECFLKGKRVRAAEKKELIENMLDSFTSIFKIKEVVEEKCYVILEDVFTGKQYKLVDEKLPLNGNILNNFCYMRIIRFKDFYFQTGLLVKFLNHDTELHKFIKKQKGRKRPLQMHLKMLAFYNEQKVKQ